jgi:hypothetical protein
MYNLKNKNMLFNITGGGLQTQDGVTLCKGHLVSANFTKGDAVFIWFSFVELEKFIADVRTIDKTADGMRIYLGRHDGSMSLPGSTAKIPAGTQTVFLVATKPYGQPGKSMEILIDNPLPSSYDFGTLCPTDCGCLDNVDSVLKLACRQYNIQCPGL